jgi:hypothetical protein
MTQIMMRRQCRQGRTMGAHTEAVEAAEPEQDSTLEGFQKLALLGRPLVPSTPHNFSEYAVGRSDIVGPYRQTRNGRAAWIDSVHISNQPLVRCPHSDALPTNSRALSIVIWSTCQIPSGRGAFLGSRALP